jgi:hypothetical protein
MPHIINAGTGLILTSDDGSTTINFQGGGVTGMAANPNGMYVKSVTTTQRQALTGTTGMLVFDTTQNALAMYNGSAWEFITSSPPVSPGLYAFTSFTFTNAGITGASGPTLGNCTSSYNTTTYPWLTNTAYFNVVTQGYQLWTVPATGNYQVTVVGAVGGVSNTSYGYGTPGRGAQMVSTLALTQGDKLNIIVGQAGGGSGLNYCGTDGAGGGGSFVFTSAGICLMAAGGGGGAGSNGTNRDPTFKDAPNSTSGNNGSGTTGGIGGTSGNGGAGQIGSCVPGGGAGSGILTAGAIGGSNSAPFTYSTGFAGGTGAFPGGFGGGAGSGINYAGGGGGGYSGGGGGGLQTCACNEMGNGGGGGSFSSVAYTYTANVGTGQGSVTITKL